MRKDDSMLCMFGKGSMTLNDSEVRCIPERCPIYIRELEECSIKVAAKALYKLTQ